MGKMKRARQKLHNAAAKSKKNEHSKISSHVDENIMDVSQNGPPRPIDPTAGGYRGENLFQNVRISSVDLSQQRLPDFDAQSTITSKTFKGQNLKKKDKKKNQT